MRSFEMIAVIAIFGTVIGSIIGGVSGMMLGVYWVLRPLDQRAGDRPLEQFRFRLIDGLCLAVQWQFLLAAGVAMDQQSTSHLQGANTILALLLCGIVLAIWAGSISRLNQARIQASIRRSAFILLQPITLLACLTFSIATVSLAVAGLQLCFQPFASRSNVAILSAVLATTAVLVIAARLVSQWIAAEVCDAASDPRPAYGASSGETD